MTKSFRHLRITLALLVFAFVFAPTIFVYYFMDQNYRERVGWSEEKLLLQSLNSFQLFLDQEFQVSQAQLDELNKLLSKNGIVPKSTDEFASLLQAAVSNRKEREFFLFDESLQPVVLSNLPESQRYEIKIRKAILENDGTQRGNEHSISDDVLEQISYQKLTIYKSTYWIVAIHLITRKELRILSSDLGLNISIIGFENQKENSPWKVLMASRDTTEYKYEINKVGAQKNAPFIVQKRESDGKTFLSVYSAFGLERAGEEFGFFLDRELVFALPRAVISDNLIFILLGSLFLVLAMTVYYFDNKIFYPLYLVEDGLRHLSAERFPPSIPLDMKTEIGAIIQYFNLACKNLSESFRERQESVDRLEDQIFHLERELFEKDILRKIAVGTSFEADLEVSIGKISDVLIEAYGCPYLIVYSVERGSKKLIPMLAKVFEPQSERILSTNGSSFLENSAVPKVITNANLVLRQLQPILLSNSTDALNGNSVQFVETENPILETEKIQLVHIPILREDVAVAVITLLNDPQRYNLSQADHNFLSNLRVEISEILIRSKQNDMIVMDPLTNLFNSRYFEQRLTSEVLRARRNGASLSLLAIEIDNFAKFAEKNENTVGEEVIVSMASLLRSVCRTTDVIARVEQGIFTIILPDTGAEGSSVVVQKISTRAAGLVTETKRGPITSTVTIGVATFPDQASIPKDLMVMAFEALEKSS